MPVNRNLPQLTAQCIRNTKALHSLYSDGRQRCWHLSRKLLLLRINSDGNLPAGSFPLTDGWLITSLPQLGFFNLFFFSLFLTCLLSLIEEMCHVWKQTKNKLDMLVGIPPRRSCQKHVGDSKQVVPLLFFFFFSRFKSYFRSHAE